MILASSRERGREHRPLRSLGERAEDVSVCRDVDDVLGCEAKCG